MKNILLSSMIVVMTAPYLRADVQFLLYPKTGTRSAIIETSRKDNSNNKIDSNKISLSTQAPNKGVEYKGNTDIFVEIAGEVKGIAKNTKCALSKAIKNKNTYIVCLRGGKTSKLQLTKCNLEIMEYSKDNEKKCNE